MARRKGWALALKSTGVNGVNALSMFERIRDIGEVNQLIRLYLTHEIRRDHVAADTEFQHIMKLGRIHEEQDYGRYETPSGARPARMPRRSASGRDRAIRSISPQPELR